MDCLSIVSPPAYPGEIFFATISDARMFFGTGYGAVYMI